MLCQKNRLVRAFVFHLIVLDNAEPADLVISDAFSPSQLQN